MAEYRYRARDRSNKIVSGTLQAANDDRAVALLRANGLTPIKVTAKTQGSFLDRNILPGRVTAKDLILFSQQIGAMIRAGVPILEAIHTVEKQLQRPAINSLLKEIAFDIEGGHSLSSSLGKHPDVFSTFYLGVVRTGEASGQLSQSLQLLADHLEKNYIFARRLRSALMYPAFVLVGVVIVAIVTFAFVIPQLTQLFVEANVALPLPTRVLIAVTDMVRNYWYLGLALVVALGFVGRSYYKTPDGEYTLSSWILYLPIVSELFKKVYLARMTSILQALFSSNVPVIESLRITQSSIGNKVYQRILGHTIDAVKNGDAISSVWEHERDIPPMLTTMVAVRERSGDIHDAFKEAHRFFQRDVDDILDSINVLLEPLLVIILGIGVAFIVAAVLLPIYNLVLVI